MPYSMPEIEDRSKTRLPFVVGHYFRLYFARALDNKTNGFRFKADDIDFHLAHEAEEFFVPYDTVFDHFGNSAQKLSRRQSLECSGIDPHKARLIKCPYHVLAHVMIHACLAADRAVHLCQEGSRYLHEMYSTHVRRCRKTGYVTDNPAAEGDDAGIPVKAPF